MERVFRNCKAVFLLIGFIMLRLVSNADPGRGIKYIGNKSQWPSPYQYGATIPAGTFFVQSGTFTYYFFDARRAEELHHQGHDRMQQPDAGHARTIDFVRVQTQFIGAASDIIPIPVDRGDDYFNFFNGTDTCKWASGLHPYHGLLYKGWYHGIDLKLYSTDRNLKYDFIVAPGADPAAIRFTYDGVDKVNLTATGDISVESLWPLYIEKKPVAYQVVNGRRVFVPCVYELQDGIVSFHFPEGYDPCLELTIDPLVIFSTYSGSTADNWGSTATPGDHGALYSAGVTSHYLGGTFPTTNGAFQRNYGGDFDIGILKYDSTGSRLLYSTYLGGTQTESPHSLVMNQDGDLLVLGTTTSADFPTTTSAYDRVFRGGTLATGVVNYWFGSDVFVSRISGDGTRLLASTLLGGTSNDGLNEGVLVQNYGDQQRGDIITDAGNNVYIATVTASPDFPVVNGLSPGYGGGGTDAVIVKMSPDLQSILWSTFLGGSGDDAGHTLQFDRNGDLFVAGGTTSSDFITTPGSYQSTFAGVADGWIASLKADGTTLLGATLTGTSAFDEVFFVDLNADDEVYVFGQTSGDFPVSQGVYSNPRSGQFIQKFDHDLSQLIFSTVIGSGRGIPDISPTAFLVNECNNIYLAGWGGVVNIENLKWQNNTFGMPVTADAFQRTTSGSDFYFMVLTADATEFLYGTYMGGNLSRTHVDGGTSRFDKGGVVYQAVCAGCDSYNATGSPTSDFPTTPGAWSNLNRSQNCNNAAFKFDLSSLRARIQSNSILLNQPGLNKICIPDPIVFQNFSIGGETFEWDLGDGTKLVKHDTSMVTHRYKQTGLYTVWLKAIDRGTCKVRDSAAVTLNVYIADIRVQDDDDVCLDSSYELQASGGVSYFWRSEDDTFQSTLATPVVTPTDTMRYIVSVTERSGCMQQDTVQLNVIPVVRPSFEWDQSAECFDRPSVRVLNTTDSLWEDDRLFFDFGDGVISDNTEVTHNFEKDGLFNVRLVAVRNACVTERVLSLPVFRLMIPNVITPGEKDNKNDRFVIQYGPTAGVTPAQHGFKTSVTIYNRWGTRVYHSDDYQYDWDGDDLDGGVYYYEVTIENHATCKSWLHLVK